MDEALDRCLPPATAYPPTIHEAMRYSVFAGGKRLRPILVIAGAEAVGGQMADVLPTACCFELIHTYSLIHDDLPAMDDDDYRRGRLTSHKVFGEAMAILAGDALLTHALGLVAANFGLGKAAPEVFPRVLAEITAAAGADGMVGGQVVDVQSEGQAVPAETLEYIHTRKTAALIRGALRVRGAPGRGGGAGARGAHQLRRPDRARVPDRGRHPRRGGLARDPGKDGGQRPAQAEDHLPGDSTASPPPRRGRRCSSARPTPRSRPLGAGAAPLRALADFVLNRKA